MHTREHTILVEATCVSLLKVVDCGVLTNPNSGHVSHTGGTTFGQTATYSCNTGYRLLGGHARTCQATGRWSGSAPTCQGMLSFEQTCVSPTLCVAVAMRSKCLWRTNCYKCTFGYY